MVSAPNTKQLNVSFMRVFGRTTFPHNKSIDVKSGTHNTLSNFQIRPSHNYLLPQTTCSRILLINPMTFFWNNNGSFHSPSYSLSDTGRLATRSARPFLPALLLFHLLELPGKRRVAWVYPLQRTTLLASCKATPKENSQLGILYSESGALWTPFRWGLCPLTNHF